MMKAIWNDQIIAEAAKDDMIYIEGNWYFPPDSVRKDFLRSSDTEYNCPWKGDCKYYDVGSGAVWSKDNAWTYMLLKPSAIEAVHKDFTNYVAFWRDVQVTE
jgi:uncharacterized protein (DUF427 family)